MIEETKPGNRPSAAKPPYAWRVLIIYSLFGSPLGAVLLLLGHGLVDLNLEQAFQLIPIATLHSYQVGGIPAFLTGLLAMLLRLKRNLPGIASITAIGALLSVIHLTDSWFFMGIGATAALILSTFLPKP